VKKTGGNPLFVEKLSANMKAKNCFAITPSLELILKGGQNNLGTSPLDEFDWGEDPETAVIVQFDRMPSDMQLILRTASAIGQNFSMDMVSQVLDNRFSPKECFDIIGNNPDSLAFVEWDLQDPARGVYKMSFKSAVLQKCIYSAMLSEQKMELHHKIASKYEMLKQTQLLPLIAFHYGQSKDVAKKIESLDAVSAHYVETGCYSDAITSLTKLMELVAFEGKKTDRGQKHRHERYARWQMLLGTAYVGRSEWSKGQLHLFQALQALDFPFPNSRFQMKLALWNNHVEQAKHWKNRHEATPVITDPQEIERICEVCRVLNALNTSFTFIGDGKSAELCLLLQLNFCESLGLETAKRKDLHFGQSEASTAMLFWMRNKRSSSLEYFGRAKSICEYSESLEDLQMYYALRSLMLLSSGRIKESLDCMDEVLNLQNKRTAKLSNSHVIHIDIGIVSLIDGEFGNHAENLVAVYEAAVDNSDDGTLIEAACVIIQNLLLAPPHFPEGTTDVTNWVAVVEEMLTTWSEARSSSLHILNVSATLFLYYSFKNSSVKAKEHCDQFLTCMEKSRSRMRSPMGYLITFWILFFLLAQHRMFINRYELKEKVEWKLKDALNGLADTIKALKVLSNWWSFATPILYLSMGLKHLFEDEPKKAVSAWRKGIKKTDEISDNLKFLKAMLQVRVVRYSQGNDALRTEVGEFLQKIGARTELSLLANEAFSPLPVIEEEDDDYEVVPLNN